MNWKQIHVAKFALIAAIGGFLMGFDASVISGVVRFIEPEFNLSKIQLGWAVGSLTLTATFAMLVSGSLSDRVGRITILKIAAIMFAISAIGSSLSQSFAMFVASRMIGGLGVGASLIIAPMYIAEIAPPKLRGRLVSLNQLNIVVGISTAFFSNYLILKWAQSGTDLSQSLLLTEYGWRWMLGLEAVPALLYFICLFFVPQSPRWLIMTGKLKKAKFTLLQITEEDDAQKQLKDVIRSLKTDRYKNKARFKDIFHPSLKLVLIIGCTLAILQQITGINAVFFYAPIIFEQSGIGINASFMQATLVGLINLVFTILAILFIDRLGRRPLLLIGMTGITVMMLMLSWGFHSATYELDIESAETIEATFDKEILSDLYGITYPNDVVFKRVLTETLGPDLAAEYETEIINAAIDINPTIILIGILGFVAFFAISIGPVMWVMFSELFPLKVRGLAISFAGFINSGISFLVQFAFPWELATIGTSLTFLFYGLFAAAGLIFVYNVVPETKNKTLEELEFELVGSVNSNSVSSG